MNYRVKNIGIAVALAALAAILTSVYVVNYKRHVQNGENKVPVYVAAKDIPAGTSGAEVVDQHMLKKVTVPRKAIVAGAISSPDQLSQYIATQDVYDGEQVSTRRFAPPKEQGIRAQIKGTQRAYQVEGDQHQLMAGTLKAGDHVDLVANITLDSAGSTNTTTVHATRIVLRDIPVLQTNGPSSSSSAPIAQQNSVILEVSDTQVQRLFFVEKNDDWTLELRPAVDAADSPDRIDTVLTVIGTGVRG
jgi:Flp pilus assembly protein CpaB